MSELRFVRATSYGPSPLASREQVEQVITLRRDGVSLRGIAERVFGDQRLKGRVVRLLRSTYALDEIEAAPAEQVGFVLSKLLDDEDAVLAALRERDA